MARHPLIAALAVMALILPVPTTVLGAEPEYVDDMPEPARVIANISGVDEFDTAARRYVAFSRLESMMIELIGTRLVTEDATPSELALRREYHDAYLQIQHDLREGLATEEREYRPDTAYGRWWALIDSYCCSNDDINEEILSTLFSPAFLAMYQPIHAVNASIDPWAGFAPEAPAVPPEPDMTVQTILAVIAVVLFVIFYIRGAVTRYRGGYGRRSSD